MKCPNCLYAERISLDCLGCGEPLPIELCPAGTLNALKQRDELLTLCAKAYDLIAGGHYHNSPLVEILQSAIRKVRHPEESPNNAQP